MMEAFTLVPLRTAARVETLALFRKQIGLEMKAPALPTTKNGRPRRLSVRTNILKLLPRSADIIFEVSIEVLVSS